MVALCMEYWRDGADSQHVVASETLCVAWPGGLANTSRRGVKVQGLLAGPGPLFLRAVLSVKPWLIIMLT